MYFMTSICRKPFTLIIIYLITISFCYCNPNKKYKKLFYQGTNILKSEGYYRNDIPIDTIKNYSSAGWLTSLDIYNANGKLNGIQKSFFENGVCSQAVNYINGIPHGKTISYQNNGRIKLIGF